MLEYVAKFTELARFADDYVTTDMAKVRKFKDGLKLSIQGKSVGFILKYMDYMIMTSMAMKIEINDARSIRDAGASEKKKENQSYSNSGKHEDFRDRAEVIKAKAKSGHLARHGR